MKVKDLIKQLKKMPQDENVGYSLHDYDSGDSDNVNHVALINDNECSNDSGKAMHRVVLTS